MGAKTLLDVLRSSSQVDCDTLDQEVAKTLGPFVDCTSNQAIAYAELQKPENEQLLKDGIKLAKELYGNTEVSFERFATEVLTVMLSSRIVQFLSGYAHIQVNPFFAYSKEKIVSNAKRIIQTYRSINPDFPSSRVCIKIPSTWEGIQACRVLETEGIHTLATTLFSMEQAALAADAGCTYIAPYVNELKVHFVSGYVDNDKGFGLTRSAQRYYSRIGARTQVLPASLISVAEVMMLGGAHHITVSPPLLAELASTPHAEPTDNQAKPWFQSNELDEAAAVDYQETVADEALYRIQFTRSKSGANEKKLVDAINIFCEMQSSLEALVQKYM